MANYKQLNSHGEALDEVRKLLEQIADKDGFMVAVWDLNNSEINYHGKVTRKFPQADYLLAISQMMTDCVKEMQDSQGPPPPIPLPFADIVNEN